MAALREGRDPDEIFQWLFARWCHAKMTEKARQELALDLLPYVKPKMKTLDISQRADVKVEITIGGDDADDAG